MSKENFIPTTLADELAEQAWRRGFWLGLGEGLLGGVLLAVAALSYFLKV